MSKLLDSLLLVNNERRLYDYTRRVLSTEYDNLIAFWPLSDTIGSVAKDLSKYGQYATYSVGGITFRGLDGIYLDGNNTHVNIRTSVNSFDALWNGDNFTHIGWGRLDQPAWVDTSTYRYINHIRATDSLYYTVLGKNTIANQIEYRRRTGTVDTLIAQTYTFANPPLDYFCMGMTCNQSIPELKFYLYDSKLGWRKLATSNSANITAWGSNPPVEGSSVLGAGSITLQEWIGFIKNSVYWNKTLTE